MTFTETSFIREMKSYGNQTISDNALLNIDNLIFYPIEGNLIIFDCNTYKELKRIFLSYSLIKIIKKIPDSENYLICCENSNIIILNKDFNIISKYNPKQINNVYALDISSNISNNSKIIQYIVINHHSIINDNNIITHSEGAFSLIKMELIENEINFEKIITKISINVFSLFNDNKLISFYWNKESKNNCLVIIDLNNFKKIDLFENSTNIILDNMNFEIKRYKKTNRDIIIIQTLKRNFYIFNLNNLSIQKCFCLEGKGELGDFFYDNEKTHQKLLVINKPKQLISIDILNKIDEKNNSIILKNDFLNTMSWGILKITNFNKLFIVNAYGIKIFIEKEKKWIEEFFNSNILTMSGCGLSKLDKNIFIYGDLSGKVTIFNSSNEKYDQIKLNNEMIRSLCADIINKIIFIGTISGKLFIYDYNNKIILSIIETKNNETITCIKFLYPYLFFSDTGGYIYIYNTENKEIKFIYSFISHEPQKDNNNIEFGSLKIKSEVWSFLVHKNLDDSLYIVSGSEDQSIKIWKIILDKNLNKIIENKIIKIIKKHKYAVTCVDWSKIKINNINKDCLLSCSDDKTISLFDCSNEEFNQILSVDFSEYIRGFFTLTYCSFNHIEISYLGNDNMICIGTQAGYLIIYDIKERKINFNEKIHYGGIEGVSFENNIISTCGNDNVFNILYI